MEWNTEIIPKIAVSAVIFLVAVIAAKVAGILVNRWRKVLASRLERRKMAGISALDTKVTILRRVLIAGIYFFAFVIFLLQFEAVKNIGTGLLASAGVAGVVLGMAAQSTLSNVIAGISISFAQPVRLGDAVIFQNDFGWIEEISLMQTMIRTWDNRRIIVPNNILASTVMQNWTIKDPSLLGSVMLYVDYLCDVEQIKSWVREIVGQSQFATKEKVAVVQVVDFTERTMVLRILSKGKDAPETWSLRCEIREKLIEKFRDAGFPFPVIRIQEPHLPGRHQEGSS
ncbi:MAG: mechanosensitive ion channel [Candidatus Omnitrophica bacterium]|nr:mechanosensitive ion channel [Candidatus Omnitrophota bacterium]